MYIPAKPAPTTTTSNISATADWLLPEADCRADIASNSLDIFVVFIPALYPYRVSADTAGPGCISGSTECRMRHRDLRRLNARRGSRNPLGFPAPDALALPKHPPNQPTTSRVKRLPQGAVTPMKSPICDMLGIEFPLLAFSHCRDVVAAVSRAGGFGVLGATAHSP